MLCKKTKKKKNYMTKLPKGKVRILYTYLEAWKEPMENIIFTMIKEIKGNQRKKKKQCKQTFPHFSEATLAVSKSYLKHLITLEKKHTHTHT